MIKTSKLSYEASFVRLKLEMCSMIVMTVLDDNV